MFFLTLLTMASAVPLSATAGPAIVSVEDSLLVNFEAWESALEASPERSALWEFPFDAPRPAGLNRQDMEIVLSLRRQSQDGNLVELESLADRVQRRPEELPEQMRFWLAFAQGLLDRNQACLDNLQLLLAVPEGWLNLEPGQQAWVLTRTPDLLFLLGKRDRAAEFYARLASSKVEQLNLWGQYQLAGLDFLAREFSLAASRYEVVCGADAPGSWREHACAMVEIAGRLSRLGKEGESDDTVASLEP